MILNLTKSQAILLNIILDREISECSLLHGVDAPKTEELRDIRTKLMEGINHADDC